MKIVLAFLVALVVTPTQEYEGDDFKVFLDIADSNRKEHDNQPTKNNFQTYDGLTRVDDWNFSDDAKQETSKEFRNDFDSTNAKTFNAKDGGVDNTRQAKDTLQHFINEDQIFSDGDFEKHAAPSIFNFKITMPDVTIPYDDTYLCTSFHIPENITTPIYITEFIPHASSSIAHHMILRTCEMPGSHHLFWECGRMMHGNKKESGFLQASPCGRQSTIIWAWAGDAPLFELPKGVGFEVGRGNDQMYLVLNVHFKSSLTANRNHGVSKTGLTVSATTEALPKLAGVYVSASVAGWIPPHTKENMDIVCRYNEKLILHPFAYRVHTHLLGVAVMVYRVRKNHWALIGQHDPQKPQMFYPVKIKGMTVKHGDWLASRCIMVNDGDSLVKIGYKHTDEMCNTYVMYWVHRHHYHGLKKKVCFHGNPQVKWKEYFTSEPPMRQEFES